MSFDEVNLLSMVDLLELFAEYVGDEDNRVTRREATQDDIDRLFK